MRKESETPSVSTLWFDWKYDVKPGQFIMLWEPGVGEVPMSLSVTGDPKAVTIKEYGPTSSSLKHQREGEFLFFRGAYGNTFSIRNGKILLVGGGTGMASLRPLIREGAYGIVSARNERELLFANRFEHDHVFLVTDDGSAGLQGNPVDQLAGMDLSPFEMIYVCGPEKMLRVVADHLATRNVNAEFSLERIMKCGIGICDSCSIDGLQLCRDGPVFNLTDVLNMTEFGRTKLNESGRRISV